MWLNISEMHGLTRLIDCAESIWMTGSLAFIFGAVFGAGVCYLLSRID